MLAFAGATMSSAPDPGVKLNTLRRWFSLKACVTDVMRMSVTLVMLAASGLWTEKC